MKYKEWKRILGERCISQRYVMTLMSFLGVVITYVLRTNISIAINKINHYHDKNITDSKCSGGPTDRAIDEDICQNAIFWDESTQGYILSSFYCGYLLAHLPGAYIARRFGGKYPLGLGVLASSLLSIASPKAACHSAAALTATRFAMGLAEGPTFPALSELLSQWAPTPERTLMSSTVFAGVQIGTVVSLAITGYLLEVFVWSETFYLLGGVGVIWFIFWVLLCYDKPTNHPFISTAELDYLKSSIPEVDKKMPTPWRAMLHSNPLWALTVSEMGHDYGLYTVVSDLPKYYCNITDLSISDIGVLSGLPYFVMWLTAVLLGFGSDKVIKLKLASATVIRRSLAVVGSVVPGIGMVIASYLTNEDYMFALVTISMAFMGSCYASIKVNPLDLSPNHAATVMAIVNGSGALSGLIAPNVVGSIVRDGTKEEWHIVFWIVFVVLVVTSVPFMICGSGNVQTWDKPEEQPKVSELRRRSTISGGEPIREKYRNYYPEQAVIAE